MVDSTPLPQGQEKVRVVRNLFDTIAPRYELVNKIISAGLDTKWRKKTLQRMQLAPKSVVVDLACGTGDFCRILTDAGHSAIGVDLSLGMLQHARTSAPLVQGDCLQLPFRDSSIDAITCGFAMRNLADLDGFFPELARVLRPGGRIGLLDATQPTNPVMRFGHGIYFGKLVPKVGALLSDASAYQYLPKSLAYLPSKTELMRKIRAAGFYSVEPWSFTGGSALLITGTRSADK